MRTPIANRMPRCIVVVSLACTITAFAPSGRVQSGDDPRESPFVVRGGQGKNVIWRARIGDAAAGLSVGGGMVLVGTNNAQPRDSAINGDRAALMCFSQRDGKFLWQNTHARVGERFHDIPGSPIRSTPFIENKRAYYISNRGELVCVDLDGFYDGKNDGPFVAETSTGKAAADVVWMHDMPREFGVFVRSAGDIGNMTCSPLVSGDLVYCLTGHGRRSTDAEIYAEAPSFLAVHKQTGEIAWQSNLPGKDIIFSQWSSPAVFEFENQKQILFPAGDGCLYSLNPGTGGLIWKIDCNALRPGAANLQRKAKGFCFSNLVCRANSIFFALHQGAVPLEKGPYPLICLTVNRVNDKIVPSARWVVQDPTFLNLFANVVVEGDLLFAFTDNAWLVALDAASGREVARRDLVEYQTIPTLFGAPLVSGGRIFVPFFERVLLFGADKRLECLGQYDLDETIEGPLAIDGNTLYATTPGHVWALHMPAK